MGKIYLITGGARSGKSSFAEDFTKTLGKNVLYIATSIVFDEEMKTRVKKHKERRPDSWHTLEAYKNFENHFSTGLYSKFAVLLDCITIMITNILFEEIEDFYNIKECELEKAEEKVSIEVDKLISIIKNQNIEIVMVTNEIGMGIVPENHISRVFRDIAGRINQKIAKDADEVYLCVSGIPIKIK